MKPISQKPLLFSAALAAAIVVGWSLSRPGVFVAQNGIKAPFHAVVAGGQDLVEPKLALPTDRLPAEVPETPPTPKPSPAIEPRFDQQLTDIIGVSLAEAFASAHQGSSENDLRLALMDIHARIPAQVMSAPHVAAYGRGEFELLQKAPTDERKYIESSPSDEEMDRNIPFVSVYGHHADGTVARTNVKPQDFAGYADSVSEAVWIHFELKRRKRERR